MALAWRTRMRTGQSGWIDAIWSAATGLAAFVLALAPPSSSPIGRRALSAGLILVWAVRLAGHISARTRGGGDDPRYAALAREWGANFPRQLFVFLQIQAAAALPLVGAVALAARAPRPFPDLFDLAAILVAAAALAGEAMADAQLAKFRREAPSGGYAKSGCGAFLAIRIIFSNSCSGARGPCSPSIRRATIRRACSLWPRPPSSIGCWPMSAASRYWKSICAPRAARRSRITPAASTPSFPAPGAIEQALRTSLGALNGERDAAAPAGPAT